VGTCLGGKNEDASCPSPHRKSQYSRWLPRFDRSSGLPEKMSEVLGQPSGLPENTHEDSGGSGRLPGNMSEVLGRTCRLPASTPDKIGTITMKPANMSEAVGNISGLPEKMSGNSNHPPAFPSGRPKNFAGISGRHFNGVEHQRFSAAVEGRTGVIATGVFRGVPTVKRKARRTVYEKI
jgi:hypothetical protein